MINKKTPMRYWAQLNGKNAQENYRIQKILKEYERRLEEELFVATMSNIDEGTAELEQDMANNLKTCIDNVFAGGSINPAALKNSTFSKRLAIGLGKSIGNLPMLLLEDLFQDD